MTGVDNLAAQLQKTIDEKDEGKKTGYDTQATVVKVAGDTIWVKIPGGVDETPVSKTVSAKEGDTVQVRVAGGRAWIVGNYTNPATDDTKAVQASSEAQAADVHASKAEGLANSAQSSADLANQAAISATESAETAYQRALDADQAASQALQYAAEAGTAAANAEAEAQRASENADDAKAEAGRATVYANSAIGQLGEIEQVLKVLDWAAMHGTYDLTLDNEVKEGKWYFQRVNHYDKTTDTVLDPEKTYYTRTGQGTDEDPYIYTAVETPDISEIDSYYEVSGFDYGLYQPLPDDDPSSMGLYELTGVDEAVSNYISTHLALDDSGLWLQMDSTKAKLQITATGMTLWNDYGRPIAQYGTDVILGDELTTHIKLDNNELGFYKDANTRVAYISGNKLFISESEVTTNLRIGEFMWIVQSAQRISLRYSPQ